MKKILILLTSVICCCSNEESSSGPEETIPFYTPEYGTLYDTRDGHSYKTTVINGLEWMAENLNYYVLTTTCISCSREVVPCGEQDSTFSSVSGWATCVGIFTYINSACYNDNPENCAKYGRMYNWDAAVGDTLKNEWHGALGLGDSIQGICPDGWRLPTETDFYERLWYFILDRHPEVYTDELERKLRSTEGWPDSLKGMDEYGFNLLPGGYDRNRKMGECASFWLSNESNENLASNVNFGCEKNGGLVNHGNKEDFRYVRCVRESQQSSL
ncbi:FISUMP domain-containing protein [Fibrobacter sp.]|uniref:FISUMP domain-containing protein n=1 Tax=Fibrobacter sp. TaxID=35828 RepID=UPI00388FC419